MKHSREIDDYNGDLESLANDIGNLHYESLEQFLGHLAEKLKKDAYADDARGRKRLSKALIFSSNDVKMAQQNIGNAWQISKPYMKDE